MRKRDERKKEEIRKQNEGVLRVEHAKIILYFMFENFQIKGNYVILIRSMGWRRKFTPIGVAWMGMGWT